VSTWLVVGLTIVGMVAVSIGTVCLLVLLDWPWWTDPVAAGPAETRL